MDPNNNPHPLVVRLAAWRLSSVESKQREFLDKLPDYWQQGEGMEQAKLMKVLGKMGVLVYRTRS